MYMLSTDDNGIWKLDSKMFIPKDMGNRHWVEYQEWLSESEENQPIEFSHDDLMEALQE